MEYYICFIWLKYSKQIVWQNDKLDAQGSLASFLASIFIGRQKISEKTRFVYH